MEPQLQIAEELERRDAAAEAALLVLERLQAEVEELRAHAGAAAELLRSAPVELARLEADERAAGLARTEAEEVLRDAESEVERARNDAERLAAGRHVEHARDRVGDAGRWAERARRERERLEQEVEEGRRNAARLEARANELAAGERLAAAVAPPAGGLHGVLDWAARARGELLVVHAGLATERDGVVREASELVAGILGEPLTSIRVAGLRDRVASALGGGPARH